MPSAKNAQPPPKPGVDSFKPMTYNWTDAVVEMLSVQDCSTIAAPAATIKSNDD